ncbi:TetR family transcriptional regulator [Paractinoplanes brasiliensis]|uniref:TetR family transcriptional regulator n=1 Tax=Paractinoplanes brasiliensis TaxID=52695 RepID=A0A4V3C8S0_9ACTN|nr:TetR family transcriptional regulator [Actinoplanes brasiliensis]TDO42518.1 TetR family transcriptional regulator [Actinoplanes brasiliensis]GID31378.1 TetR family transcriptional regulator [Actinoplanes brasiliensis]
MGRWEPNAQARLRQAALDLYSSRGFENTTVAEIAEAAGLTERTFFRHFTDKREVLFAGSERLQQLLAETAAASFEAAGPSGAVATAFEHAAQTYFPELPYARQRQSIIDANPPLQERELAKLNGVAAALAEVLRGRGVPEPSAAVAAESGVAAFKVAFARWVTDPADRALIDHMREAFDAQRLLFAAPTPTR